MAERDNEILTLATERFERRLAEENGRLRIEMASGFGALRTDVERGFGALRSEMIDRNAAMLRWLLIFGVTQTAAILSLLQFGN